MGSETAATLKELDDLFKLLEQIPKFDASYPNTFESDWNDWRERVSTEIWHIRKMWIDSEVETTTTTATGTSTRTDNPAEPWELRAYPEKPWGCAIYNTETREYWMGASGKRPQFYSDRNRAIKQERELNKVYVRQQLELARKGQ